MDSPVKEPVASEMPRSAPPYTDRAREEPCRGGGVQSISGDDCVRIDGLGPNALC